MHGSLGVLLESVGKVVFRHIEFTRKSVKRRRFNKILIQIGNNTPDDIALVCFGTAYPGKFPFQFIENKQYAAFRNIPRKNITRIELLKRMIKQFTQLFIFRAMKGNKVRFLLVREAVYCLYESADAVVFRQPGIIYPQHIPLIRYVFFDDRTVQFSRRDYHYISFFQLVAFVFNVILYAAVRKEIYLVIIVAVEQYRRSVPVLIVGQHKIVFHR